MPKRVFCANIMAACPNKAMKPGGYCESCDKRRKETHGRILLKRRYQEPPAPVPNDDTDWVKKVFDPMYEIAKRPMPTLRDEGHDVILDGIRKMRRQRLAEYEQ